MADTTTTREPTRTRAVTGPQAAGLRVQVGLKVLVGLTVVLAVAGAAVAGLLLARSAGGKEAGPAGDVVGRPVHTAFGAFTVTNAGTTFVPDTQGPPTAAQHDGTKGSNQLQVWVRLTNERAGQGLAYAPTQLRLIEGGRSGKGQQPSGSTIEPALLPRGGSVDGQVWFDLPKDRAAVTAWVLTFSYPGAPVVRVDLGPALVAPTNPADKESDPHQKHGG